MDTRHQPQQMLEREVLVAVEMAAQSPTVQMVRLTQVVVAVELEAMPAHRLLTQAAQAALASSSSKLRGN